MELKCEECNSRFKNLMEGFSAMKVVISGLAKHAGDESLHDNDVFYLQKVMDKIKEETVACFMTNVTEKKRKIIFDMVSNTLKNGIEAGEGKPTPTEDSSQVQQPLEK